MRNNFCTILIPTSYCIVHNIPQSMITIIEDEWCFLADVWVELLFDLGFNWLFWQILLWTFIWMCYQECYSLRHHFQYFKDMCVLKLSYGKAQRMITGNKCLSLSNFCFWPGHLLPFFAFKMKLFFVPNEKVSRCNCKTKRLCLILVIHI